MTAGNWYSLYPNGFGGAITIAPTRTLTFDILVVGRTAAGESAGYQIQGVIENNNGIGDLIGTPTVTVLGEDDAVWNARVTANEVGALVVEVQGNGEYIRWVATVRTVEVAW